MPVRGFKPALRALFVLGVAILVVATFSRLIAQPAVWLPIYQVQFEFTPASWMANKLLVARQDPARTCVLLGASTTREGFDSDLIDELAPGIRTVNLGTTGGGSPVDILEIQARILSEFGDRYRCIVVGLHPMFLRAFDFDAYELLSTEYAALLPLSALFDMTVPPWKTNSVGQLAFKYFLPMAQYAEQIRRMVREQLFAAHSISFGDALTLQSFEEVEGELRRPAPFYPPGSTLHQIEANYAEVLKESGWASPELYGHPEPAAALQTALRALSKLTERLIVVEMPQSFLLDGADAVSRPSYEEALRQAGVAVKAIQCVIPRYRQYDLFYDAVHLNSVGRVALSRELAPWLATDATGSADAICVERNRFE